MSRRASVSPLTLFDSSYEDSKVATLNQTGTDSNPGPPSLSNRSEPGSGSTTPGPTGSSSTTPVQPAAGSGSTTPVQPAAGSGCTAPTQLGGGEEEEEGPNPPKKKRKRITKVGRAENAAKDVVNRLLSAQEEARGRNRELERERMLMEQKRDEREVRRDEREARRDEREARRDERESEKQYEYMRLMGQMFVFSFPFLFHCASSQVDMMVLNP